MKKKIAALILAAMAVTATGCGAEKSEKEASQQFFAMDTVMNITAYGDNAENAVAECVRYINDLENDISRTKENSEIYELNKNGSAKLSEYTAEIVKDMLELAKNSGGYFDPTVANLSDLWQIGTEDQHIPKKSEIEKAKSLIGYDRIGIDGNKVTLGEGMKLDLGGIGKGYAADKAVEIMQKHGVERAVIALGGNVYVMGEKDENTDWRVGITDPDNTTDYIGVLEVSDKSVVTSGDYERYFQQDGVRYCHIFDIKTGYPVQGDIRSVTIADESSTKADAYTTALFAMGYEKASEFCEKNDVDAVFLLDDGTVHVTDGLKDSFKLESNNYRYEE